ncbi:unnamed protein product [Phaedon cochleariae]|uniref:Uncharacterized protein n=1 Tax=Phaedon cochleariae TaxID=80249 RepID=A0A9N9X0X0_PHACE|nr:unnamed protein product [Phaedon cochleariae]
MSRISPTKPCPKKLQVSECEKQNSISESTKKTKFFNTFDYVILTIISVVVFIYIVKYFDSISWQLSSIGRIFLIKLLPYYDWKHLKNKECLIDSPWRKNHTESILFNCDVCENIDTIDVYRTLDEDILEERYINLDIPVILTSGLETWPKNSGFIDALKSEEDFFSSYPCKLSTNIFKRVGSAGEILDRTHYFDKFFLTFQNCDLEAMRVLRRHCYRPDNIPPSFSPTMYNWLLWNKHYNMTAHKSIDLVENFAVFGQLFGSTHIRLIPRKNCQSICPFLSIELNGREMLLVTDLWDLEYRALGTGENMAVIMELRG